MSPTITGPLRTLTACIRRLWPASQPACAWQTTKSVSRRQTKSWAVTYLAQRRTWDGHRASSRKPSAKRREALAEALRQVIAQGRHRDSNDALRRVYGEQSPPESSPAKIRFLLGAHDIDVFSAEMANLAWALDAARSTTAL